MYIFCANIICQRPILILHTTLSIMFYVLLIVTYVVNGCAVVAESDLVLGVGHHPGAVQVELKNNKKFSTVFPPWRRRIYTNILAML